jgi:Ca-activated chloride channel family protein
VTFEWPVVLVGLLLVPLLAGLYVLRERRRRHYAAKFSTPGLLPNLVSSAPGWKRHLPLAVLLVGLAAMVVGVARPHADVSVKREEATVIIAIDTSLSMRADDVKPTRLMAARKATRRFVAKLPQKYRVGIVGFAGRAYVALPPTTDRTLVPTALQHLRPGEGTSLGDAVALATQLGKLLRAQDGTVPPVAIVVFSDGAQLSGRTAPGAAAVKARNAHIPVYTVVLGTNDGVITVPLAGGFQAQLRVPPRPETMRTVAQATGGRFFTDPEDPGLDQVSQRLGSRLGNRTEDREISNLFAGGSAALLLFGGALSALWFRRVP